MEHAEISPVFKASLARFTARAGPIRQLKYILCWENSNVTTLVLLLYTFFCLYPVIRWAIPVVGFFAMSFYRDRRTFRKKRSDSPMENSAPDQIEELLLETDFHNNLMLLQSILNCYCYFHDKFQNLFSYRTLPDTKFIPQWDPFMIFAFVLTPCSLLILPWMASSAYFWIAVGWVVLIPLSPFSKATLQKFSKISSSFITPPILPDATHTQVQEEVVLEKCVELFENQRWWFGLGFQPLFFSDERTAWTNQEGKIAMPPKETFPPPIGYFFTTSQWQVDHTWAATDDQGWLYMDHFWQNPSAIPKIVSVTRARRWIRPIKHAEKHWR